MSASKGKQQKTLLSFFSPPSRAASDAGSAKKEVDSAKSTTSSASAGPKSSLKSKPDPTRKRIDFSPKPARKADDAKPTSSPSAKKAGASGTRAKSEAASPAVERKRKAYEDFLGTSEDEDGGNGSAKTLKKKDTKASMKEEEAKMTASGTRLKRLRKSNVRIVDDDDDDDDEEDDAMDGDESMRGAKRKAATKMAKSRNVVSSEDEWDPSKASSEEDGGGSDSEASEGEEEDDDDDDEEEEEEESEEEAPVKKRKLVTPSKARGASTSFLTPSPSKKLGAGRVTPPSSAKAKSPGGKDTASVETVSTGPDASGVYGAGCHIHDSLPWLNENRRDINGNTPDSPDYDPRTIKIPADFLKKETPAMAQWWEVKSTNMDTVLFFKVGKFYELFHMDADIGFKELNLIYMKGEKAHSGFPEIAYGKFSSQLVAKGYRVARVEQTETPDMMKARNAKTSSKSKVVRREVCSLLSVGTNTLSFLDAPISTASQERVVSTFLMALKEREPFEASATIRYGVCLVDCATGAFHLAEFDDTEQRDRLKTLFAQFNVVEVVNERNGLCADTKQVIKFSASPSVIRSELVVGKEFWNASRTVEEIIRAGYFKEGGWPDDITSFLNMDKTVKSDGELAISALGGCVWHLRRSLIDQELVSLCNFKQYKPSDEEARVKRENEGQQDDETELNQQYVVLDSQTIQNLEILTNNYNGSRKGSLIDIMDKTMTAFGKRLFQEWVLKPLCKISEINERLDAVEELGQNFEIIDEVRPFLSKMHDLERLLSRIHALGSTYRSQEHPDSRAIMYESGIYNVRKIRDFLQVLSDFDTALDLVDQLGPRFAQLKSPLLKTILKKHDPSTSSGPHRGHFPELREKLEFFKRSFDQAKAAKTGVIVPQEGADPDYDDACESIVNIEKELDEYLQEQRTLLRSKQVNYWGTKKEDRYQLEVPETALQSGQPKGYELKSRKKGYKRFHTPQIRDLLAQLTAAEERKATALKDQTRRIFHKFDEDYRYWMKAVQCLAVLDCLLGLAIVSSQSEGFVRPEVVSAVTHNNGAPFVEIEEGVHPCVAATFDSGDFIPNDTHIGLNGKGQMILLSGPNMGGKSTLLRQTCVLTLMAQIGCFVPAAKCRLSPVDRIFTRIGASDRILAGQSTLYVELSETATILNHASKHSLVILDELGRGTSTFDGTAIAYSVVEFLLREVACRSLFATHYHSLVEEYLHESKVALGHMGCMVDPENERKVTFLYKLEDGMCPKSYGLNVAMLAKLPDEVIDLAAKKSEQFEQSLQANSHNQIEALKLTAQIEECLRSATVDVAALQTLWTRAQGLVQK